MFYTNFRFLEMHATAHKHNTTYSRSFKALDFRYRNVKCMYEMTNERL